MSTLTKSVTVSTIRGGSDARGIGTPGGGALPSRPPGDSPGIGVSTRSRPPHRPGRSSPPHLPRNRSRGRPDLAEVNPYVTSGYNTPGERLAGRRDAFGRLVARRSRERADRLRPLPAGVQPQAGRPRLLLRPPEPRRRDGADDLRAEHRVLHRPDREEAAEPFLSRHERPVVRHGRLQPRLQVLPELGHLEVARGRAAERGRDARGDRRGRAEARLPERRLHLQRPGHLGRVRDRDGPGLPRGGDQDGRRHGGLHHARGAGTVLRGDGRGQRRPQGVHRGVLPAHHLLAPAAGARHARVAQEGDGRLVRDHQPGDPAGQRRDGRHPPDVRLDPRALRRRGAAALHGVPPRLPDAGPAEHPARDAARGA